MNDLPRLLEATRAYQSGHFELSSGQHSDTYIQCAKLLQFPSYATQIGHALALKLPPDRPDVILGPAYGGIVLAQAVAGAVGARAIFTERVGGVMLLRRGFEITPGDCVAITEDVVTTGGSTKEVIQLVQALGGYVTAILSIIDRSGGFAVFDQPFYSLIALKPTVWAPDTCPMCAENQPITKPGSRPTV